ncbi:MAG: transcriptional regulator, partial [Vicinamibacterales bacterium]
MSAPVRYRFGAFVLSPRRRVLTRDGRAVPLIPKYFDVLLLLVRRRDEAVSKGEIFDDVWRDVVVSDGALSQAVRTLRRVLEDEARDPRYIRTVSRHGYQFVWAEVVEEPDDAVPPPGDRPGSDVDAPAAAPAVEGLVDRLLQAAAAGAESEDDARAIAAELHQLGTRDAVARLVVRPRHARALAIMRDARWSVPAAEAVPLLSDAEAGAAVAETVWLRLRAARPALLRRWGTAAGAGAAGGAVAGFLGGGLLMALTARATWQAPVALAAIGGLAGGAGAAGLAAGLSLAEAAARSHRRLALTLCTGAAVLVAGGAAQAVFVALAIGLAGEAPGRVP